MVNVAVQLIVGAYILVFETLSYALVTMVSVGGAMSAAMGSSLVGLATYFMRK
jgi:hypothetical protein